MTIEEFVDQFDGFVDWTISDKIDSFVFFLTQELRMSTVTVEHVRGCFDDLSMRVPKSLQVYLSSESAKKGGKYLRGDRGSYKLERTFLSELKNKLSPAPAAVIVSDNLTSLIQKLAAGPEKDFASEALKCFKVGAYRAGIVMTWVLTMNHLHHYILADPSRLTAFNAALSRNPSKRINKVAVLDDFSELREDSQIEIMRSAGIISNDVRKILDQRLGTRNSAAHPSTIVFSPHKAEDLAIDLVQNVILKFQ